MLNVGLIGSMASIVSYARNLKNYKGVRIIGKSSVGAIEGSEAKSLVIPEFNRRELVETADLLIVERSSLLFPDLLRLAIRRNKHLYFSDFPDITLEECTDLLKLADEAETLVKIRNPLLGDPLTHWIAANWQEPACITLYETLPAIPDKKQLLIRYLYYAFTLFNAQPQKIRVSGVPQEGDGHYFMNFRLDYPTWSTFSIDLRFAAPAAQMVRAALPGKFLEGNALSGKALLNQHEITLPPPAVKEEETFAALFEENGWYRHSDLPAYCSTLSMLNELLRKLELYTPWNNA